MSSRKAGKKQDERRGKHLPTVGKNTRFKPNDPETGFQDQRINRSGQNRKFTEVRHLMQGLFDEKTDVTLNRKQKKLKLLEIMLRDWLMSRDFQKQNKAYEIAYGKIPEEINVNSNGIEDFLRSHLSMLTDGQIDRLKNGESSLVIVGELIESAAKIVKRNNDS